MSSSAAPSPAASASDVRVSFLAADLALATVPGTSFDPASRRFSLEELKPQPIIRKRHKVSRLQ